MKVSEVMQREVVFVSPDDDVKTVLEVLKQHELPGLPVVNSAGRCVGIVTESDLVISDSEADLHLPLHLDLFGAVVFLEPLKHFESRFKKAFANKVVDLMTKNPVTVSPDMDLKAAAEIIAQEGHNRLPVVEHGQLVGLVTRIDVLQALVK